VTDPLPAEVAAFITSGISVLVGTRDARLVPESTRGVGARVEAGGAELTVFLADATSARALANLQDNGRIAVCFSRAIDHRSIQLKGPVLSIRAGDGTDQADVERWVEALGRGWQEIGIPPAVTRRLARWPVHAVRFRIEEVFVQTPGPGAGAPLSRAGGGTPG
jgi:hypothetical protein